MHEGHIGLLQQFVKNISSLRVGESLSDSPCLYRLMIDGGIEDEQARQSAASTEVKYSSDIELMFICQNGAEKSDDRL